MIKKKSRERQEIYNKKKMKKKRQCGVRQKKVVLVSNQLVNAEPRRDMGAGCVWDGGSPEKENGERESMLTKEFLSLFTYNCLVAMK